MNQPRLKKGKHVNEQLKSQNSKKHFKEKTQIFV